uniref:Uncharacterized protein n=1 Tax=Sphaerodactylus townsendi TaxID=933632 RepID=A0ACB8FTW7_9SAUR
MPYQRCKRTTSTATPHLNPETKSKLSSPASGITSINYKDLKRPELQKHCKTTRSPPLAPQPEIKKPSQKADLKRPELQKHCKRTRSTATPQRNPEAKSKLSSPASGITSTNYKDLKRPELQKHCKRTRSTATPQRNPEAKSKLSPPASEITSINYKDLKKPELQKHCKKTRSTATSQPNAEAKSKLSPPASEITSINYKDLKKPELQKHCKRTRSTATPQPNPEAKSKLSSPASGITSINYKDLKRPELQKHCKKLGLCAIGKNTELVERLLAYRSKTQQETPSTEGEAAEKTEECCQPVEAPQTVLHPSPSQKVVHEPVEEKKDIAEGWCVVHGMALYRPLSSWAPLLLRRGLIHVQDGENLIPFHLHPLNTPVPDGLLDNHICGECVLRNQEILRKVCCKTGSSQYFLNDMTSLSTSHCTPQLSFTSNNIRRATWSKKMYQAQEDPAYAQMVDGILTKMAHGEIRMDQVLRPLQPLVVHSPAPFKE